MIYTSYFANKDKPDDFSLISIARFTPNWFYSYRYDLLSPSVDLLSRYKSGIISDSEYTKEFNSYLNSLDCEEVYNDLISISGSHNIVLLCYEKPDRFCHRHLVSKWLSCNGHYSKEWCC